MGVHDVMEMGFPLLGLLVIEQLEGIYSSLGKGHTAFFGSARFRAKMLE